MMIRRCFCLIFQSLESLLWHFQCDSYWNLCGITRCHCMNDKCVLARIANGWKMKFSTFDRTEHITYILYYIGTACCVLFFSFNTFPGHQNFSLNCSFYFSFFGLFKFRTRYRLNRIVWIKLKIENNVESSTNTWIKNWWNCCLQWISYSAQCICGGILPNIDGCIER